MNIVVISTASLLTPPTDYGGMELQAYLLVKGLEGRGHSVRLIAKTGSTAPRGGLIEVNDEREIPQKYIGVAGADVYIDMSHNKLLSHAYPDLPLIEQYQVMSMTGLGKNPVLISHGQHITKFPGLQCEIIYQHIDLAAYEPNYLLPHPYFLTMAQIIEEKRIDWSIKVALVVNSDLHVFGPWWGDGNYMNSLRQMAQGAPQIKLNDSIGGVEKLRQLREARALLHFPGAKGFCEAGSIIVLEALASGTPVIVSDNGVHREYILDGYNGYVVSSIDEAVEIIQSGGLDAIDRRNCRKSVEQAGYQVMAEQYERLCERVVNRRAVGRMSLKRDIERINDRVRYLLTHEDEQTWDERIGHSGEYEEWTSLVALKYELQLIAYTERLDAISAKLDQLSAMVKMPD